jgi:hypothetical protein
MALPPGWIAVGSAPETQVPSYTGDQTSGWVNPQNKPGSGVQPKTALNPAGQITGIPVMTLTPKTIGAMFGPQSG